MTVFDSTKSRIKLGFMTKSGTDPVYWLSILKEEKQLRNFDLLIQKMIIRAKRQAFFPNVRNIQIYDNHSGNKIGQVTDLQNIIIDWNVG